MAGVYEGLEKPRCQIEKTREGDVIRVRTPRPIGVMLFLAFWLAGWTLGGGVAMRTLLNTHFEPFVLFWLCGWAVGWIFAARTLAAMMFGSQTLAIVGRDQEVGTHIGPFARRKLYRGTDIRNLMVSAAPASARGSFGWAGSPATQGGAVQFDYGARTIYVAAGLSEAEGRSIIQHLARRLPASALPQVTAVPA